MAKLTVRDCRAADRGAVVAIYNHYVRTSAATFDLEPCTVSGRASWFDGFAASGPYRLLVADQDGAIVGFCSSQRFKDRPAYDISIETTVYVAADALGRGVGASLYRALFERLEGLDLHRAYAGITLPNEPSVRLHRKFGFHPIGIEHEVGRKFGRYWSVGRYEKRLQPRADD